MSQKIDLDHGRFRQIIRGKIKQNLRKYISQGEMIARKGKDNVSIPIPSVDIPHFKHGDKQQGGVGQGTVAHPVHGIAVTLEPGPEGLAERAVIFCQEYAHRPSLKLADEAKLMVREQLSRAQCLLAPAQGGVCNSTAPVFRCAG